MALRIKLALAICAALAACGPIVDLGGQSGPAARVYNITGNSDDGAGADRLRQPAVVLIEEPFTSGVLDSDRIAILLPGGEIQFLSGARWSERPVRMTRRALQDSLDGVSGLTALGRGGLDIPNDYRLKIRLRDFQVDSRTGPATSLVSIQAWLVADNGRLIDTETFTSASDLITVAPAEAVSAIQSDLSDVSRQLTLWLSTQLNDQAAA